MPRPISSASLTLAHLRELPPDGNSQGEPPPWAMQELEASMYRTVPETTTPTECRFACLKANNRERNPALLDGRAAKFVAAVDQGLANLRKHLLQTLGEYSTETDYIASEHLVFNGNGNEEMFLMSRNSGRASSIGDSSVLGSASLGHYELVEPEFLEGQQDVIGKNRLSGVSEIEETEYEAADHGSERTLSRLSTSRSQWSKSQASDIADVAVFNRKGIIRSRWARFVHLVMTLGRAKFQLLPCWIPSSVHVEDVSHIYRLSLDEVGFQRQHVDHILHAWNVQQNIGLRTFRHVMGSVLSDSDLPGLRKKRRFVLHPLSTKRILWSLIGLICIIYDFIMISLDVFDLGESSVIDAIDWVLRIYWVLDIVISFRTGFYNKARYEDEPRKIAKNYLTTWFVIDVIAVIPDWFIELLENSSDIGEHSQAFRYLKIFKMLRLVRMAKMASWIHHFMESLNSINLQLSIHILKYAVLVIVWVHVCAVMWYAVAEGEDNSWITRNQVQDLRLPVTYFISVQWAFAQLQGSTDLQAANTTLEQAFSSFVIMLSIFVLAVFISNITNTLIQLQSSWSEKARQLRALQDYLHRHKVTPDLSESVRKYCAEKLKVEKKMSFGEDDVLNMLPKGMRRALLVEVRSGLMKDTSPVLAALCRCHISIYEKICCDIVEPLFVEPDTLVYNYGEECPTTYFVVGGELFYDHINNQAMGDLVRLLKSNLGGNDGNTRTPELPRPKMRSAASMMSHDLKFTQSDSHSDAAYAHNSSGAMRQTSMDGTTGASQHVYRSFLRERLHDAGTIINSTPLAPSTQICEAALWTTWSHYGDLNAIGHSAFLVIDSHTFQVLVEHDHKMRQFGVNHAVRFCRVLNDSNGQHVTDLLTSNDILDALYNAGEMKEASANSVGFVDSSTNSPPPRPSHEKTSIISLPSLPKPRLRRYSY